MPQYYMNQEQTGSNPQMSHMYPGMGVPFYYFMPPNTVNISYYYFTLNRTCNKTSVLTK